MSNSDDEYMPGRVKVWTEILMELREMAEIYLLHYSKECAKVKLPQALNEGQRFQKPALFTRAVSDNGAPFATGVNSSRAMKAEQI